MPSIHTTVEGNIGKAPESKTTREGKHMATFTVFWNCYQKDKTGQDKQNPDVAIQVRCFDRVADNVMATLQKGMRVIVTGRMEHDIWHSQKGPQKQWNMLAEGVGVSLRFATAQVTRNPRQDGGYDPSAGGYSQQGQQQGNWSNHTGGFSGQQQGQQGQQGGGDPWNNGTQAGADAPF